MALTMGEARRRGTLQQRTDEALNRLDLSVNEGVRGETWRIYEDEPGKSGHLLVHASTRDAAQRAVLVLLERLPQWDPDSHLRVEPDDRPFHEVVEAGGWSQALGPDDGQNLVMAVWFDG